LAVGASLTIAGARSVARPLEDVRTALARVEQGDLDVSVKVDDAGEIGQLQAGFNRMVTGLRERERLKQLFSRHVGPDVAQRAVDASGLGGVELDATVMFVDVIGSTTLAAERPPESVVAMLNALFGAVVRAVGAEGGLVNQFQGDGALCVFGAPSELPDHAARALRAVSVLRRDIVELGDVYPGFGAAIGVSSGRVVGGDVGTEDRYEYTVIGDAANEASRLTDEAKQRPGRVLVSQETVRAAGATADGWLACGELVLRGRPAPTVVYEPA
jgi:adenylate cyclase